MILFWKVIVISEKIPGDGLTIKPTFFYDLTVNLPIFSINPPSHPLNASGIDHDSSDLVGHQSSTNSKERIQKDGWPRHRQTPRKACDSDGFCKIDSNHQIRAEILFFLFFIFLMYQSHDPSGSCDCGRVLKIVTLEIGFVWKLRDEETKKDIWSFLSSSIFLNYISLHSRRFS